MAGSGHAIRGARLGLAALVCVGLAASDARARLGPNPAQPRAAHPASRDRRTLAARYLAIAKAGNRRLDHEFGRLDGPDRSNLRRSRADLHDIAATEHVFDRRLSRIPFGPRLERTADSLYRANQKRATLTTTAARSSSLHEVHDYEQLMNFANGPVERAVSKLRRELGLPPPPSS